MPGEEPDLEGQDEQPLKLEFSSDLEKLPDDGVPDTAAFHRGVHRDRADFAEVRPQHMQSAAANHAIVHLGDPELLDRFIQCDEVLLQQDLSGVGVNQPFDLWYV